MFRFVCQCYLLRKTRLVSSTSQKLCLFATKSSVELNSNNNDETEVKKLERLDEVIISSASELIQNVEKLTSHNTSDGGTKTTVTKKPRKKNWKRKKKRQQEINVKSIEDELNRLKSKPELNATFELIKNEIDFEAVGAIENLRTLLKTLEAQPELVSFFTKFDGEQLKTVILSEISKENDEYNIEKVDTVVISSEKSDDNTRNISSSNDAKVLNNQSISENLTNILALLDSNNKLDKKLRKKSKGKTDNNLDEKVVEKVSAVKHKKVFVNLNQGSMTTLFDGVEPFERENNILSLHELKHNIEYRKFTLVPNKFGAMTLNIEKQWEFPIDNDQDIQFTENFGDHVFLDHLLEEFPNVASIQSYMELVITGLQQNPYLSAEEKVKKIMWHKEYFESFPEEDISVT